uniref:Uncharacterized protein n=1 Tax=Tetradesmus obliquus TaxID=3088 RepID=A0A383VFP8_TETOB|eukprot:jgi/Sobl393_1/12725/SZX63609.1
MASQERQRDTQHSPGVGNHGRYYDSCDDGINPNLPFQHLAGLRSLSLVNTDSDEDSDGLRVPLHCHTPEHPSFHRQLGCMGSSLTSLKLHSIELSSISSDWRFLSSLTSLEHLDLQQAPAERGSSMVFEGSQSGLGGALPALSHLTRLRLEWQIDSTIKLALGMLTQLQELRLHACGEGFFEAADADSRLNLPHSLTHLDVKLSQDYDEICAPDLASLTALQHLQLQDAEGLDVGMMSGMARLTHLQLCMAPNTFDDACMMQLLDVLSDSQQLRHLQLEFCNDDSLQHSMVAEQLLRQCSALTASSHLTSLQLSGVRLPAACGEALFPADHFMPHLTTLKLRGRAKCWWHHPTAHGSGGEFIGCWRDIDRLIECCPSLIDLDLAGLVQRGVDMSELRHLWRLTSLVVSGKSVDDDCAEGLAQLTQLRVLTVIDPAKGRAGPPYCQSH